jgi:hypothetical protein
MMQPLRRRTASRGDNAMMARRRMARVDDNQVQLRGSGSRWERISSGSYSEWVGAAVESNAGSQLSAVLEASILVGSAGSLLSRGLWQVGA